VRRPPEAEQLGHAPRPVRDVRDAQKDETGLGDVVAIEPDAGATADQREVAVPPRQLAKAVPVRASGGAGSRPRRAARRAERGREEPT
jgi:hypothetical protein